MTVADFYGRKSNKDDGRSVASQEHDFADDCTREGLTPGRVFADPDKSASRFARKPRPDYLALVEHIRSGQCEMLSIWEASRGSRNLAEWVELIDLCRAKGVLIRIVSHNRTYDVRLRRDWRTLADEGIDSADESEKIRERVTRGKRMAAIEGRPVARLAYGFKRIYDDRGEFVEQVEHPEQAAIVREIFRRLAEGESAYGIAQSLNARGIPTPHRRCAEGCAKDHRHFFGGQWSGAQIHALAMRPSYAGLRVHQGKVIGEGRWKPIVKPERWNKVNALLSMPGRKTLDDTTLAYWLTGAVFCGLCAGRCGIGNRDGGRKAYVCKVCHRVSASERQLEAELEPLILDRLALRDTRELLLPQQDTVAHEDAAAELADLEKRLKSFYAEAAKPKGISAEAIAAAEQGLLPQIEALRAVVKRLAPRPSIAELEGVDVVADWHTFSVSVRRQVVRKIAHIVLLPGSRDGSKKFDLLRLAPSKWTDDTRTWGEIWAAG